MKRKFWNLFWAATMCVAMVAALPACSDDEESEGEDNTTAVDGGTGTDHTENVFVTTNVITPIRYAEGYYVSEGTEDVAIEVTSLTSDNICFTVTPSQEVMSYLVQVYPLASIYNTFINEMNSAGASLLTVDETTLLLEQIVGLVEDDTSGGKLMNEETLGSNYACYEFDWYNTGYLSFLIQPEAEYLIVVQACFDTEGESNADLCVVHVTTPSVELVGSPAVTADIEVGYSAYDCIFVPNEDCYYVYYLVGDADEIYQYVNAYGESIYRDFLRHYGGRASADSQYLEAYANNLEEEQKMVATAIALDINGSPAADVYFEDFQMKSRPEGRMAASGTMSIIRHSATVVNYKMELDKYAYCIYYGLYTAAEAETYKTADDETRADLAETLSLYGYGFANPNYSFDLENGEATGEAGEGESYWQDLTPSTEYVFIWIARNAYGDLTDLCFSDSFTTYEQVRDKPETSKEDVIMTIPEVSRTSVTMNFTYDPDNTAVYYFQYYSPVNTEDDYTVVFPDDEDSSDEARYNSDYGWLYWLLDYRDDTYGIPWSNAWLTEGTYFEKWPWTGFESGTTYKFVYVAEDWDGVLGEVKFAQATTYSIVGGPNPEITNVTFDPTTGYVVFTVNDDTRKLYYTVVDYGGSNYTTVALADLLKRGNGDYYKSEYLEIWEDFCISSGITTVSTTGRLPIELDSEISIALAVAEGADSNGDTVYSEMVALVYTPSVGLQTFDDYWEGNTTTFESYY